jgi:hypothetical protein
MFLSSELSVSPAGVLSLGHRSIYGEILDMETGDAPFIPKGGFEICGICEVHLSISEGCLVIDATWLSRD